MTQPVDRPDVVALVERLVALARQREALIGPNDSAPVRERARELAQHTSSYLLPRARDLDAPVLVVLLGPTGAGKSTLLNTISGGPASETGVLRPTTRDAVVLATAEDVRRVRQGGPLGALPEARLRIVSRGARTGLIVVDAPDVDSVERDNRALADVLVEVADLCVFVTTASRYADQVPWDVLGRVAERRLPFLVVINRLPAGPDAAAILSDARARFVERGMAVATDGRQISLIGVSEGDLETDGYRLRPGSVRPLLDRLDTLVADRAARRALAEEALAGALAGLAPLTHSVADDLDHQAIDADALRRVAAGEYSHELSLLIERLQRGGILRDEVVRQWHSFVGADQVTRMFSSGIGRARGALMALFRGMPQAPAAAVQKGATDDLTALVVAHAHDAARRAAANWSATPSGAPLVSADAALWTAAPDLAERTRLALDAWIRDIGADVAEAGADKRPVARGLSLGVNAGAVTIMLGVFAHTGGLTGAEMGVAAATAFLNQKLLNALFGEAAVIEMVERARWRLRETLLGLMDAERARFDALVPDGAQLRDLAGRLRAAVDDAPPPSG